MQNPTLVVLIDRNDLDDQLFGQFQRCHDILGQLPVQAETRKTRSKSSSCAKLKLEQDRLKELREKTEEEVIEFFKQWAGNANVRAVICGPCLSPKERSSKIRAVFGLVTPVPEPEQVAAGDNPHPGVKCRRWLDKRVQVYNCGRVIPMSKKELASLGAAEAEILQLVWELQEATVQQIFERLPKERGIAPATVQTVLRRLRDKGYLKSRADARAHVFFPSVKPETVITKTVRDLVNRFFGGKAAPLMLHLAETQKLEAADLKRLRKLLKPDQDA